jgi:hypothetical protein
LTELSPLVPQRIGVGSLEADKGFVEQFGLPQVDESKIHFVGVPLGHVGQVFNGQQAFFNEKIGADQVGIAGEGREALVGRVAVTGGAERQDLPEFASAFSQVVDEAVGEGA